MKSFPEKKYPAVRYFLGDIRDYDLLEREVNNFQPDLIFHLAQNRQRAA